MVLVSRGVATSVKDRQDRCVLRETQRGGTGGQAQGFWTVSTPGLDSEFPGSCEDWAGPVG